MISSFCPRYEVLHTAHDVVICGPVRQRQVLVINEDADILVLIPILGYTTVSICTKKLIGLDVLVSRSRNLCVSL